MSENYYDNTVEEQKNKPPVDTAGLLLPQIYLIGRILGTVPVEHKLGTNLYGWSDYLIDKPLKISRYEDSGQTVHYRRIDKSDSQIWLTNIRPGNLKDTKETIVPTGKKRSLDSVSTYVKNDTDGEVTKSGKVTWEKNSFESKTKALELGFRQSLKQMIRVGNETTYVGSETTVEIETKQTTSNEEKKQSGERSEYESSYSVKLQPHSELKVTGTRVIQPSELVLEGSGDLDYSIEFGKRGGGHWARRKGKYRRYWSFNSKEDLIRVFEGRGERDLDGALYFRENPVPEWLLRLLKAPPSHNGYRTKTPFDETVDEHFRFEEV